MLKPIKISFYYWWIARVQLVCQNRFRTAFTKFFLYFGIQIFLFTKKYCIFHRGWKARARHNNNNSSFLMFQSLKYQNITENFINFSLTLLSFCYQALHHSRAILQSKHLSLHLTLLHQYGNKLHRPPNSLI